MATMGSCIRICYSWIRGNAIEYFGFYASLIKLFFGTCEITVCTG